jgi:hypothetical protein
MRDENELKKTAMQITQTIVKASKVLNHFFVSETKKFSKIVLYASTLLYNLAHMGNWKLAY